MRLFEIVAEKINDILPVSPYRMTICKEYIRIQMKEGGSTVKIDIEKGDFFLWSESTDIIITERIEAICEELVGRGYSRSKQRGLKNEIQSGIR